MNNQNTCFMNNNQNNNMNINNSLNNNIDINNMNNMYSNNQMISNNFNNMNNNINSISPEEEIIKLKTELLNIKEENRQLKLIIEKENREDFDKKTKMVNIKKIRCITIISTDQKVIYGLKCLTTETFADVEERLYKEYPEYRETNNIFQVNGKQVLRFKTIEENNIQEGQIIQLINFD